MKDIFGYEGRYAITEDGRVWSYRSNRFLKPSDSKYGYWQIHLGDDAKTFFIHRLVAEAFIANPKHLPLVDHIDRNRKNNSVSNLRWVNAYENSKNRDYDAVKQKQREVYLSFTSEQHEYRERMASISVSHGVEMCDISDHKLLYATFSSSYQAAIQLFNDPNKNSLINRCAQGKIKSAYGYFWRFV